MNKIYFLLFGNIILLVIGQVLWKISLNSNPLVLSSDGLIRLLKDPLIWGGLTLYGLGTVIWFIILSKLDLSVAYPLNSIAYVIGLFAAIFILKENVQFIQWIGVAFIMIGVYFISRVN